MPLSEYHEAFLSEAKDNLQALNDALLKLEKNPFDQATINEMFRAAHNLKGMAATMNYNKLAELCHGVEDCLDKVRKNERKLTPEMAGTFYECFDNVALSLRLISAGQAEADVAGLLSKLTGLLSAPEGSPASEALESSKSVEASLAIEEVREIKVKVETLDTMVDLVEELLVNKMLLDQLYASEKFRDVPTALDAMGRLVSDLQYTVMQARLVQVEQLFKRFPRMIRDLTKKEQKQVNFVVEGAEIELDRKIVDKLGEPLIHLLRNAVDHGIELPKDREKMGKPATGTIKLVARREKEYAVIEVEDDGAGVDDELIKRVAVEKGVISRTEAADLGHSEAVALLFDSRFSTTEKVTEVSGRGVGLDVVRRTIESLGGIVQVATQAGKGMKVTLKFPLTLAIISALLTKVGDVVYAVPLANVASLVRVKAEAIGNVLGQEVVVLSEGSVPLLRLQEFFKVAHERADTVLIALVKRENEFLALGVDEFLTRQNIVVKPLDRLVRQTRVFAGFTILGDGKPALILDVNGLFDSVVKEKPYAVAVS